MAAPRWRRPRNRQKAGQHRNGNHTGSLAWYGWCSRNHSLTIWWRHWRAPAAVAWARKNVRCCRTWSGHPNGGWLDLKVVVAVPAVVVVVVDVFRILLIEAALPRGTPVRASRLPLRRSRSELFVDRYRWPYTVGVAQGKTAHSVRRVDDGSPCGAIPGTAKLLECLP